jgi:multidrug efflux pump subunit AcrB
MIILADNSVNVRNRLSLISGNGILGFILIIVTLFIFLDAKSGLWVAMGIPFSLGCTMILASFLGHTINNMTLAGVIIVLGMVVDDAIVVAENVTRLRHKGLLSADAVVTGTFTVFSPIVASITTTCVAFIPLYFFRGRFGLFVQFLLPIIFLMLGCSLFESLFILPSHLHSRLPRWVKIILTGGLFLLWEKSKGRRRNKNFVEGGEQAGLKEHWFMKVENAYGHFLTKLLRFKAIIFLLLGGLLVYAGWVYLNEMKFTMFPREETTELFLSGSVLVCPLPFWTIQRQHTRYSYTGK